MRGDRLTGGLVLLLLLILSDATAVASIVENHSAGGRIENTYGRWVPFDTILRPVVHCVDQLSAMVSKVLAPIMRDDACGA